MLVVRDMAPHGWPRLDMGGSEIRIPNSRAHPQSSTVKYGYRTDLRQSVVENAGARARGWPRPINPTSSRARKSSGGVN